MHAKKIVLRGYVRPKRDYFLAVCIDLNLVAQGETVDEALHSLRDAIDGYLEELNANPDFYKETIPRKSPKSFYFEYCFAFVVSFCRDISRFLKARSEPKQEHSNEKAWLVEQYSVKFTNFQLA